MISTSLINRFNNLTSQSSRYHSRAASGFTIIEVLIVLAIAGLIMLVVFLAVPNLQRSQRNSARKASASRISTATSNFVANNNGTLPAASADVTAIINDAGTLSQYPGIAVAATLGTAAANKVSLVSGANAALTVDGMQIATGAKCGTSGAVVAGNARNMALQYVQEVAGGTFTGTCTDM